MVLLTTLLVVMLVAALPAEAQKGKSRGPRKEKVEKQEKSLLGDGSAVAAKSGTTTQSAVEVISIPADPNLPTFLITVKKPFEVSAQDSRSGGNMTPGAPSQNYFISDWLTATSIQNPQTCSWAELNEAYGRGVAAKMATVLSKAGNVAIINYDTYQQDPGRYPNIFVVEGNVTDFTETDGLNEQVHGADSKIPGKLINTVGRIIDQPIVTGLGALVTQANIGKRTKTSTSTGMVGLDITVTYMPTGQMWSDSCQGTFTTESATQIKYGLGTENSRAEQQASAIGQAGRAALNDATVKILDILKRQAAPKMAEATPSKWRFHFSSRF